MRLNKKGFTLVEIMIVVAIIGLLAAIAIPNFMRARATALANARTANLKQIESAIQVWAIDNGKDDTDSTYYIAEIRATDRRFEDRLLRWKFRVPSADTTVMFHLLDRWR